MDLIKHNCSDTDISSDALTNETAHYLTKTLLISI